MKEFLLDIKAVYSPLDSELRCSFSKDCHCIKDKQIKMVLFKEKLVSSTFTPLYM